MAIRNKIRLIILGILIQLFLFSGLRAGEIPPGENESKQEVSGPEQHQMTLVSFEPWVFEGEVLGLVVAYSYDDVTTDRPTDYGNFTIIKAASWRLVGSTSSVPAGRLSIVELLKRQTNSREFLLLFQTAAQPDENIQMPFGEHAIEINWRRFPPSKLLTRLVASRLAMRSARSCLPEFVSDFGIRISDLFR